MLSIYRFSFDIIDFSSRRRPFADALIVRARARTPARQRYARCRDA